MSAIKAGNSVWRSNAAHELGYLNPAIHRQIYTAGMNLPRTFEFNDPYIGNWFFRAPVFTKNGMTQIPTATPTSSVVPAPIVYNNTYRAPYAIKAGNLSEAKPTSLPSPTPKPAYIAPGLTVEQVAVPKQVVPVVPTTSIVPVQPSVMPAQVTRVPDSNVRVVNLPYRRYEAPTIREVATITPIKALPGRAQQLLPEFAMHHYVQPATPRQLLPELTMHHYVEPSVGTQLSLFKKGGKAKKIRKCEDGLPGYTQGLDLGIGFDNQGNVVNIDPVTGLPKEPTLAEIGRALPLTEASKTATSAVATKGGSTIDLNQQASHIALRRNADGNIATRTGDVIESTSGNGRSFTQGSDQKTPYN